MHIPITHGNHARTRLLRLNRWQLAIAFASVMALITLASGTVCHFIFLKAARDGWPIVSQLVKLVVRDELAQRDRFMYENLDAMARKVGEMQAKLIKLEAVGERVSGLAGLKPEDLRQLGAAQASDGIVGARDGPFVPAPTLLRSLSPEQMNGLVGTLDEQADARTDLFTLLELRLLEARLQSLMVPNSQPVDGVVGSDFGSRADTFFARASLHAGLDFPADVGTPIHAAAGGAVLANEHHTQYGHMVEIDHGCGLVTRYAHASKLMVQGGDIVKRGQLVAQVGTSRRSTGPHLHFEVLVDGVPQDPARFLAGGARPDGVAASARTAARPIRR